MLFTASFYYLTHASVENTPDTTRAGGANVQAKAAALADILVSPGSGWYDSTPCVGTGTVQILDAASFDPDAVSAEVGDSVQGRFGLGEELCLRGAADSKSRNNLSYEKILSLYESAEAADPSNDRVDYEEARKSLGLAEGEDFHIRSWPIMSSVYQLLDSGFKDPLMRPIYIGDYEDASESVTEHVEYYYTVTENSDQIIIRFTIDNDGTEAAIFATLFEIPLDKNTVGFTLHTPLLAPEQEHTLEVIIRKSADWAWKDPDEQWITFEIQDIEGEVGDGVISLAGIDMSYLLTQTNVFVEADELYWVKEGASVTYDVTYMAFTGDGTKKRISDWKLWSTDPLGIPSTTTLASNAFSGTAEKTALLDGYYKQEVKTLLGTATWNIDYVNIVETEEEVHRWTTTEYTDISPNPAVAIEGAFIDTLVEDFENGVFSEEYDTLAVPYVASGDIFPDLKTVMDNDLVDALTDENGDPVYDYTMMIVGSDVDHNAMTSAASKYAISDWVMGGGTLIVFGSDDQSVQWLQPLFQVSLETAGGPIQTPDEGHPILQVPNALDYSGYAYDHQWAFGSNGADKFTEVISTGGGAVLAVSNPGSFGDGRVILSSWRPYDLGDGSAELCDGLTVESAECQALLLVHNTLTLSYRYLFLDYGPEIPTEGMVGSQLRVVSVYHPELRELVSLQLQVFVFD